MALTDIGLLTYPPSMSVSHSNILLDAAEEHCAYIVPIPKTGTLKKIGWRVGAVASPVLTLQVSLETVLDAVGVPVATSCAAATLFYSGAGVACAFTDAGDTVDDASHGLVDNTPVIFKTIVDTTGIAVNRVYYVVGAAENTFQVSLTIGGAAITLTTNGTGTYTTLFSISEPIVNPAAGVRFDAINGSTGVSVTKGDLVSVVVRCTVLGSGSASPVGYGTQLGGLATRQTTYAYTYLGGASAVVNVSGVLTLEYDGEFIPCCNEINAVSIAPAADAWGSNDAPDRRGLKFKFLFGCKLKGAYFNIDTDEDCQIILYDSDEYTAMAGFPITLQGTTRRANEKSNHYVEFPTEPTIVAGAFYRLVVLPTTTTDISATTNTPTDDGAVTGMSGLVGGVNFVYTTFNGAPEAGSHAWTDDATKRPGILLVVSQIDLPAAGNVTEDDTVGGAAGTYHEATEAEVQSGVEFGAASALTGTYVGVGGGGNSLLMGS